jgi:AraC family transcriptional regulator
MAEVQLKDVDSMRVAALHKQGPVAGVGQAFQELFQRLTAAGAPLAQVPPVGVFYGEAEQFDPNNAAYDVCAALAGDVPLLGDIEVKDLPAVRVASAVHRGPYDTIGPLYTEMFAWLQAKGLRVAGPVREVYVVAPGPGGTSNPEDFVTEVQVPIVEP